MITRREIERDGDRILWRIQIDDVAVLDVLTDAETLARALNALATTAKRDLLEEHLGTFGPYSVTLSRGAGAKVVAVAIDGPALENKYRGNQAIVFYLDPTEVMTALDID